MKKTKIIFLRHADTKKEKLNDWVNFVVFK